MLDVFKIKITTNHTMKKIILLCVIHYAVATSPLKESKVDMVQEWTQSLSTSINWLSKVNNEELFYDILPGEQNNSLAVLEWINPIVDRPNGFNLTIVTHIFDSISMQVRTCFFPLEEDIEFQTPVKVTYLRNNRVLVYFAKVHRTKGSVQIPQVINTEVCKLEESINTEPYVKFAAVHIVPFKRSFHVVFKDERLCPEDSWCRLTFDHDGKKINGPVSIFPEEHNMTNNDRMYPLNYELNKEDFVAVMQNKGIYSPIRKWIPIEDFDKINHFYSNTSGYTSVCWQTEDLRNIKCIWLDETHRDENGVDSVITIPLHGRVKKMLYTHNTPNGNIAILKEGKDNEKKVIFSDTSDFKSKCKRYMKVKFVNELKRVQLSIVNDNKSCISFVTRNPNSISESSYSSFYAYSFESKCSEFSSDFQPEKIDCGKDYA